MGVTDNILASETDESLVAELQKAIQEAEDQKRRTER